MKQIQLRFCESIQRIRSARKNQKIQLQYGQARPLDHIAVSHMNGYRYRYIRMAAAVAMKLTAFVGQVPE